VIPAEPEIHRGLQASPLTAAHLNVSNDIVSHGKGADSGEGERYSEGKPNSIPG
jgi:hypothetical protein